MIEKLLNSIKLKIFCQTIAVTLIMAAAILGFTRVTSRSNFSEFYARNAEHLADSVAHLLTYSDVSKLRDNIMTIYYTETDHDNEDLERYAFVEDTPEYKRVLQTLDEVRRTHHIKYATLVIPDLTNHRMVFLVDADALGGPDAVFRRPGESIPIDESVYESFKDLDLTIPAYKFVNRGETSDTMWSASSAVTDPDGNTVAYAVADVSMQVITDAGNAFLRKIVPFVLVIMFALAFLYAAEINRSIVKPVEKISDTAKSLISRREEDNQGATSYFQELHIKSGGDEIEVLADSLGIMERELNGYIENLRTMSEENARIHTELSLATRIQEETLPTIFPPFPEHEEVDLYASMQPAKEVGGDFYDFLMIDEDHMAMVVADVSGKGVPAALFMMISKALLNNTVRSTQSPARTLEIVNDLLCENNKAEMFVTVWLGIVELSTGIVTYANAGHEYPMLYHNGKWEYIWERHGFVLAGMENIRYKEYTLKMEVGDILFQYTDGITEASNSREELFGMERLLKACEASPASDSESLLGDIRAAVAEFTGDAPQFDDMTMLSFRYC